MTIETTAVKVVALGNGATTVWPFTFMIPALEDVTLTLVDVASGNQTVIAPIQYTVAGLGNPAGGSVTYPLSGSPVASTTQVVVERRMPLKQETDLQNQGAAYPETIEDALDYLTMVAQQLQDQINRSIVFNVADSSTVTLPSATARANKVLGFDSGGNAIAVAALSPSVTVSAAMIPVVTAPTTNAALTALGFPGAFLDQLIPAGTVFAYCGTSAPTGFALGFGQPCTGSFPVLRALLVGASSPFGTNGTDPLFPDCRGRSNVGKSNMGGVDNGIWAGGNILGAVAGTQSVQLVTAQIPSHRHSVFLNDPGHFHSVNAAANLGTGYTSGGLGPPAATSATDTGTKVTNITVRDTSGGGGTANQTALTGGDGSHENRHPSIVFNILVKAH
jgi:microcystin-dependent protein